MCTRILGDDNSCSVWVNLVSSLPISDRNALSDKDFSVLIVPCYSQEFADSLGIPFLETSAKNATNVEQSFMTMAAEIKKRMGPGATAGGAEKSNVKIQSTPVKQSGGGCC